jgi:hypothetical protein
LWPGHAARGSHRRRPPAPLITSKRRGWRSRLNVRSSADTSRSPIPMQNRKLHRSRPLSKGGPETPLTRPSADRQARIRSRIDASGSGRAVWLLKMQGRDRRPVFFTFIPDDKGQQRERNRTWKPTFESEGLRNAGTFHPRAALCACPKPCNHPYCQRVAQIGTSTVKSPWKPHLQPW